MDIGSRECAESATTDPGCLSSATRVLGVEHRRTGFVRAWRRLWDQTQSPARREDGPPRVLDDRLLQFHERRDPASAAAADPSVHGLFGSVNGHLKEQFQAYLSWQARQSRPWAVWTTHSSGALLLGKALQVLSQRVTGTVMPRVRWPVLAGRGAGRPAFLGHPGKSSGRRSKPDDGARRRQLVAGCR
jgi:hypothetical protein